MVILITGASSGIGRAAAQLCAQLGASIIACGRDAERLDAVVAGLPGTGHKAVCGDLVEPLDRKALIDDLPQLDGCVFSAGQAALVPMRMVTQGHIDAMFSVNYNAPVLLTQGLLAKKKIKAGGSLVYISAVAEHTAPNATGIYSGAKAALTATVRCIALEQAKNRIRANCISPGYVDTPMLTSMPQSSVMEYASLAPLGMIEVEDVAASVAYLLAPASHRISRTTMRIDAGLCLHVR